MSTTVIDKKRLAEASARISRFSGFTIRKFVTHVICEVSPERNRFAVYHGVADQIGPPSSRQDAILSLSQKEAEAVVSGFIEKTDEEIEAIARTVH